MVPSAFGIGWCPLRLHVSECIECPNWCPTRLKLRFAILGRWVDGWMNIGWGVLARVRGPKLIGWLCVCVCGVGDSRRNEWMSSLVELSFNSTSPGIVVGSWLFCIQHFFFVFGKFFSAACVDDCYCGGLKRRVLCMVSLRVKLSWACNERC